MDSKGLSGGIYRPLSTEGIDTIHNLSLIHISEPTRPKR